MKNAEIEIIEIDKCTMKINIKNEDGEIDLIAENYNGFTLALMNPKIGEIKLLDLNGDVELLSGPLKGEICLLLGGTVYLMPKSNGKYENNIPRYYDEDKGYVFEIGNKTLMMKSITENYRYVGLDVKVEEMEG